MKRLKIFILLAMIPFFLGAQSNVVNDFYEDFKGNSRAMSFEFGDWMLKTVSQNSDDKEVQAILENITKVRLLLADDVITKSDSKQLINGMHKDNFSDLIQIREKGNNVQCLVKESGDFITDVVLLVTSDSDVILLNIMGKLTYDDLRKLDLDIKGAEHLKKLPKDRPQA